MTRLVAATIVAFAVVPAAAAGQTGAGQALQRLPTVNPDRINEEQRERLQERATPENAPPRTPAVEVPAAAAPVTGASAALRFTLTDVRFDTSAYFSAVDLRAFVAPLIGKEVTLVDLQGVVNAINAAYAKKGLTTARAALPPQQIEGGVVRIRLVEGRIGKTVAEGASAASRTAAEHHAALPPGSLATPDLVADRLRLFNLNNDAQLRARLIPGAEFGSTDVTLVVAEPRRFSADVFFDNNGFQSTGEKEVGAIVRGYRLLSDSDRITGVVLASSGVVTTNGSWSSPIGDRLRVSVSGSYGRTRVLYGSAASLGIVGSSYSFGGDIAGLLVARGRLTVTLTAALQNGLSTTAIGGSEVIRNRTLTGTTGAVVSVLGARVSGTVQGLISVARVRETLSGTTVTPVLFQGSGVVAAAVAPRIQARLRGDWQVTGSNGLPGVLQYQFGGSRTLRAYSPGAAAGDDGYSAGLELAYAGQWHRLGFQPYVFVDHAEASIPDQHFRGEAAGAGIDLQLPPRVSVRGSIATDIGRAGGLPRSTRAFASATFHF